MMVLNDINLEEYDPEIWEAIHSEALRQEQHIELIASENYTSKRVLEAQGSVLTNKYAEGYPGKRYYGGCAYVDQAELLAIERAKQLFKADYANVQPHSGSQANAEVYMALMNPGDTILGMSLAHGGHLTHGSKVNFSGKLYNAVSYGINLETGLIDYENVADLAKQHQPKVIVAGFSAYSRIIEWEKFREIADSVGAYLVVDMAHVAGLVAAGLYPSPVQIADVTTSTTHKTLRGPRGGLILAKQNQELEKKLNSAVFPCMQGGPLMHVIAAKAVAFKEALTPQFKAYQQQVIVNAKRMANIMLKRGYSIVSGGTDNHLFLVDLIKKNLTGKDAEAALSEAHITVNKNAVPNDPLSPMITSGLRLGTPAVTTRGFKESECDELSAWICDILDDINNKQVILDVKSTREDILRLFNALDALLKIQKLENEKKIEHPITQNNNSTFFYNAPRMDAPVAEKESDDIHYTMEVITKLLGLQTNISEVIIFPFNIPPIDKLDTTLAGKLDTTFAGTMATAFNLIFREKKTILMPVHEYYDLSQPLPATNNTLFLGSAVSIKWQQNKIVMKYIDPKGACYQNASNLSVQQGILPQYIHMEKDVLFTNIRNDKVLDISFSEGATSVKDGPVTTTRNSLDIDPGINITSYTKRAKRFIDVFTNIFFKQCLKIPAEIEIDLCISGQVLLDAEIKSRGAVVVDCLVQEANNQPLQKRNIKELQDLHRQYLNPFQTPHVTLT